MLSYILPTRNRPQRLQTTLNELGGLPANAHDAIGGGEVIVVDNASSARAELPSMLTNGLPVRRICLDDNLGAAARNIAAARAHGDWLFMLDDDSYPLNCNHVQLLPEVEEDVAAIGAQIVLPNGAREAGGLPEVIIGCGAAIRRQAFLDVGGYDPTFHYYVEEYDLCAKLIRAGWRIVHDFRIIVRHDKVEQGRDMNLILQRLVRNNGWVAQRYAPDDHRDHELARTIQRYAQIALKEHAACGFARGAAELLATLHHQPRVPLSDSQFARFTGTAHIDVAERGRETYAIVDCGKNDWAIERVARRSGRESVQEPDAEVLVIGTLSPGPMMDAYERRMLRGSNRPVILPWLPRGVVGQSSSTLPAQWQRQSELQLVQQSCIANNDATCATRTQTRSPARPPA